MHSTSPNSPQSRERLLLRPEVSAAMTPRTAIWSIRRMLPRLVRPLLVTMVAIAGLTGLIGFAVAPRQSFCSGPSEEARLLVQLLAQEAFPRWSMSNPGKSHPSDIRELTRYNDMREPVDPWGRPLLMLRPGEGPTDRIGIVSFGPDGKPGNGDDIRSWDAVE
ncbi:MAG TPA: type II secretion system protein GspG [Kofleriaceae bacterium]|nr:type II secretion system protein GspG [Kofleriaceae bacterium]